MTVRTCPVTFPSPTSRARNPRMAGTVFAVLGSTNPTAAEMLPRAMLSTESTTEATSRPICCARSDRPFVALAGSAGQQVLAIFGGTPRPSGPRGVAINLVPVTPCSSGRAPTSRPDDQRRAGPADHRVPSRRVPRLLTARTISSALTQLIIRRPEAAYQPKIHPDDQLGSYRVSVTVRRSCARSAHRSPVSTPWVRAWTSRLPSAVASTGPAMTGAGGVGDELAEQLVLRSAADDVDDVDPLPGEPLCVDRLGERDGEAVQDAPDDLGRGPRRALPRFPAGLRRSATACRPAAGIPVSVEGRPAGRAAARRPRRSDR